MARPAVMLRQASRLVPFEANCSGAIQLSAELIWRIDGWLELSYGVLMQGSSGITDLVVPDGLMDGHQSAGQRKNDLWTTTCCEAFLAFPDQQGYTEINLSTNGDWAVYHFEEYRVGRTDQALVHPPEIRLRRCHHHLRLDARLPISPWGSPWQCPDVGLTMVLEHKQLGMSHWALRHAENEPDFHCPSTFLKI